MLSENTYSLLPFTKEDFSAIAQRECFCYPPFDPKEDDDPVSLDTFFCNALEDGSNAHFFRVYKLVDDADVDDIRAIACISNSSIAGVRMLMLHPLQSAVKFYQSQGCLPVFTNEYDSDVDLMYLDVWRKS